MQLLLKYFQADINVGDLASPYLFSKISGHEITPIPLRELSEQQHYMGVGSTLAHSDGNTVVWGTGIQMATLSPKSQPLEFIGVRGPLTKARMEELGYGEVSAIGDAALCMPQFYFPSENPKFEFGLIPHYVDEDAPFCDLCREKGGLIISPHQEVEPYLTQLVQCKIILSSSLHGLIFAHAYRIPALWVRISDRVFGEGFKFRDYYAFMGRAFCEIPIWNQEETFETNLAKADCPPIPSISIHAPEMLHDDLVKRGYI